MTTNDPASKPGFLTGTQQIVVECRLRDGYEILATLPNGNIDMCKGKHRMIINCLGYDVYILPGNVDCVTQYYTDRANSSLANRAR
jgi:hypothetical protein